MTSEREFRSSGHKDALKELLENPTLKLALEIIAETAKPRGYMEPRAGVHLDTLVSQRYHKQAGIQAALDHLRRLTEPPPTEADKEDELESRPFFSSLPEAMQKAIREQMNANQLPA